MSEIIVPSWADFEELISVANQTLLVCTPYYSKEGIGRLFDALNLKLSFNFWTRLSPSDWAAGVADPAELIELLELAIGSGSEVDLGICQRLHAKAYVADEALALVGSANLSSGGFAGNLELMVRFRGTEALQAKNEIFRLCQPSVHSLLISDLRKWVEEVTGVIEKARMASIDEADVLSPAQASLDEMLGYGQTPAVVLPVPGLGDLKNFIHWLRGNLSLSGAQAIIAQFDNTDGNNRTGHVKQCFFGATRFLSEHPQRREFLSSELDGLAPNDIFQMYKDPELSAQWIHHLDMHATDVETNFSYPTLRTILPPQLGGTRLGGGGASGTIKRVLPLVARYELEQGL